MLNVALKMGRLIGKEVNDCRMMQQKLLKLPLYLPGLAVTNEERWPKNEHFDSNSRLLRSTA